jgi:hypothetical protein
MTDQTDSGGREARPTTYHEASSTYSYSGDARERHDELTQRELLARSYATLRARGEYDPAEHGTGDTGPLTLAEHLEVIATGEIVARHYRHPVDVDRALQAGATWQHVADARGCDEAQARQEYREWAEGQHGLWTGQLGGEPGRFGLDDAGYAAAIARAAEPDPGAAKAYAATHRVLCAHADDDGEGAHWLAPGERCTRGEGAAAEGDARR